jgi:hypothetical protein
VTSRRRLPLALLSLAALAPPALVGCGGGDDRAASTEPATVTLTVTQTVTTTATTTPAQGSYDPDATLALAVAERSLDKRGYATLTARDFRPDQTLKVLIGVKRASDPRAELAFFFVGDRFIGTDTLDPSASIVVADQQDTSITLTYGLYRPGDDIDAPSAGTADVTFTWDGERLRPQQPIPAADPDAALSRR